MKILLVGDIFGSSGRKMFDYAIQEIKQRESINFVVANGENIAHGKGINEKYYRFLRERHVDVVTLGNHSFQNKGVLNFIDSEKHIIRPLNYPEGTPGKGYVTLKYNDVTITVFQVLGKVFVNESDKLDCPFKTTEKLLEEVKSDIYICDFHAEATSEKIAFGLYFDGRVNIIVGTHTHVQTNDAHILPNGTMYMTDLGMTGALDGVIGVDPQFIRDKFLEGQPARHEPYEKGKKQFCGLIVEINEHTQKVTSYDIVNMIQ